MIQVMIWYKAERTAADKEIFSVHSFYIEE